MLRLRRVVVCALVAACTQWGAARVVYRIETVAGAEPVTEGSRAITAQLAPPQGIAADRRHNVYIAVPDFHRVYKITPSGAIVVVAGTGRKGMSGDGGPATQARLNLPYGLAVDAGGALYIADKDNQRVRRVGPEGNITTVAGTGAKGSRGDGGPAAAAELMSPRNLAFDTAGNLYISEFEGHRIRRVARDGAISTVAGTGVAGYRGDGGMAAGAQLDSPAGLAVDSGNALYFVDSGNRRVRRILPGGIIETYFDFGLNWPYSQPVALVLDARSNLLVADRARSIVLRVFPTRDYEVVAGVPENSGYVGDGSPARDARLSRDLGEMALDDTGNLFLCDGLRIRRVSANRNLLVAADSLITTIAGDAYTWFLGDNGPATAAQLNTPWGLAMDAPGNLYIADRGTGRIRKVGRDGIITTVAGSGGAEYFGEGVPAPAARLNRPSGVAWDPAGNLYIADTFNHRVRQVAPGGAIRTVAGTGGYWSLGADGAPAVTTPLNSPTAVAADLHGTLWVADTQNHRVLAVDGSGMAHVAAGNGTFGFAGDGGLAYQAQLNTPTALAVDAAGNLYIADSGNHRIRKVTAAGTISTVAGIGDCLDLSPSCLITPGGLAVDGDGNLFIADTWHHRILRMTPDGRIAVIAGGTQGFSGDGGWALDAELNCPRGLLIDGFGNLYAADSGNQRIRKLSPAVEPEPVVYIPEAEVVNAASLRAGPVASGELVVVGVEDAAGVRVLFDGVAAHPVGTQPGRVVVQVPALPAGKIATLVEVQYNHETYRQVTLAVAPAAPGVFTLGGGAGQAAALNEDGSMNGPRHPAPRGSVVSLFGTGDGGGPLDVHIGGAPVEVLYSGAAPGLAGVFQVNLRLPGAFGPSGSLEVEVFAGGVSSQRGVTLAVGP